MKYNPKTCDIHAFVQWWENKRSDQECGKSKVDTKLPAMSRIERHKASVNWLNLFKSEVIDYTSHFMNP